MASLLDLVHLPQQDQNLRGLLHTPREIAQQPHTWIKTFELFLRERSRLCSFLERAGLGNSDGPPPVVFLIGAGTSDYIGHALALLLRQNWHCEVLVCASTSLLPNLGDYVVAGQRYLWISFSRSGDSPEGVAVLEQAFARFATINHLVVTCNRKSRMLEICSAHAQAEVIVLDDAVNDRSLVMTSSFTNMIVMGQCLAHAWSIESYRPVLESMRAAGDELLVSGFTLASKLAVLRFPKVCMVGTGALSAVARESCLKVLEMSGGQVRTLAETTLGLRHGPMAALDDETILVCFVSGDSSRRGYAVDLLREIGGKKITAARVAIGPAKVAKMLEPHCEEYLPIEADIADDYRPILDVLFGQLLGLCTSIEHGSRPDAPSPDGVISRVVRDFAIYR